MHLSANLQAMVLLEDVGRSRWLSFYLPMNEANRLARVLGKTCCAGVPIFDLIGEIAEAGGLELVRAEIDGDHQGVVASLVLRRAGRDLTMVCLPADALALALRAQVPILASEAALATRVPPTTSCGPLPSGAGSTGCAPPISRTGAPPGDSATHPGDSPPESFPRVRGAILCGLQKGEGPQG